MELVKRYTDTALVAALQTGEGLNAATRHLYREYFDLLRIYITQNQGSRQDAEDIFQEVVVTFIELVRLNKFRGESSVKTFLYALNRHAWLNELKRRNRAEIRETKFEQAKDEADPDVGQYIAGRESRKQVMDVVERLGDTCKKILLAFYYDNAPMKQILKMSGYESEQVVRNKKVKCLKQLEQMLTANPEMAKKLKSALHYER